MNVEAPPKYTFHMGTLAWVYATQRRRPLLLLLAGMALGLTIITKNGMVP